MDYATVNRVREENQNLCTLITWLFMDLTSIDNDEWL
jgi:hypothetical protein